MSKKDHAKHSPSSLDSLAKCVRFRYGDMNEGSANEGTLLHENFEKETVQGLTESQAKDVQACIDYVNSLKASEGGADCWIDQKEVKIELKDLTYGTCDRLLTHKSSGTMHVIDAKFTRVSSEHWRQLRTYGAGAVEMRRETGDTKPLQVRLHVVAPRLSDIKNEDWDGDILLTHMRQDIEEIYSRVENPWQIETPHEEVCGLCANASRCPSLNKTVAVAAQRMGLPVPEAFEPGSQATLRDRAIAQVLAGAMDNWAKLVKQANAEHCKQTGEVPEGFKLVTRSTGLKVAKEMTPIALQQLEAAGFDRATLLECCSLTIGEVAEKHSAYTGVPKTEVKERVREALGDLAIEGECSFLQRSKRVSDEAMLLGMG